MSIPTVALTSLGYLGVSTTAVLEVLMDALEDSSSEVKSAAAAALGMLSAPVATDALAACLADGQSHVRAAAAKAIGQIGGKSASTAVPKLLQTLRDPDHVVRRCSAVSLGRIGTFAATAAPYLADAMRDSHAPVREAAAISISRLGVTEKVAQNVCIQCLVKRGLTDTSSDVRQAAAESLLDLARTEQLGVQKAFVREAMTTRMKDDNAKVRATASTCLNMLSLQEDALCRQKLRQRHKAKKKIDTTRGEQPDLDEEALDEEDIDMLRDSVLELEDIARLVCQSLPECEFWVWGQEEGEQKCWFRLGDDGREAGEGWISGGRACHPPGQQAIVMGNVECWIDGFNYDTCCDPKFGPSGNAQCWDGVFNYDRCCFPKDEL
eukprot:s6408_g2.t1